MRVVFNGGVEIVNAFRQFHNLDGGGGLSHRIGFIDSEVFLQRGDKLLREEMGNISIEIAKVEKASFNLEPHRLLRTLQSDAE